MVVVEPTLIQNGLLCETALNYYEEILNQYFCLSYLNISTSQQTLGPTNAIRTVPFPVWLQRNWWH
jgi:hypothetical protein